MELIEQTVQVGYLDYLEETIYYFSKDKYKNALKRINIISKQYKHDLNALFYGGLCYYNLGNHNKALNQFDLIINLGDGPFTQEAYWYKAKTEIQLENIKSAKKTLKYIITQNGFYSKQAIELVNTLN